MAVSSAMDRSLRTTAPWILFALYAALLVGLTWQRWGNPLVDPGLDLSVAAGWLDGTLPYRDVRYWYGPLGLSALTATFAVFGTSLSVAFGYGLVQTAVIAELTRRVARRWVPGTVAIAGAAVVLAIGFSGSLFNFQLPHTVAATTAIIALLALLLAISHDRYALAGCAAGAVALTRPEFLVFAAAAVVGAGLGLVREGGWRHAAARLLWLLPGTLLVAGPPLGYFAAKAGAHQFIFENVVPLDFAKAIGPSFEASWHPYDLPSVGLLLLRGVVFAGGVWTLLRTLEAFTGARAAGVPTSRVLRISVGPMLAFGAVLVATLIVATVLGAVGGDAGGPAKTTASELGRLLLPMTALPAIAGAVLIAAVLRWWRHEPSPLGGRARAVLPTAEGGETPARRRADRRAATKPGWAADGALIATAAACSLRSYGQFSTDVYATYYAVPVVILGVVVLYRAAARLATRQVAATSAVLVLCAGALSAHALIAKYPDAGGVVHAPRGTYKAPNAAAPAIQGVIDALEPRLQPGDRLLSLPQEPGFPFLLGARPALYDATFLPGTLATPEQEAAAVRTLLQGPRPGEPGYRVAPRPYTPPRYVIAATWNFAAWGFKANGVDVNVELMRAIRERYAVIGTFGDTQVLQPTEEAARAYTLYELRPTP